MSYGFLSNSTYVTALRYRFLTCESFMNAVLQRSNQILDISPFLVDSRNTHMPSTKSVILNTYCLQKIGSLPNAEIFI